MIFIDTSAWYARLIPSDPNHEFARRWSEQNNEPFITTDYVIDETLTLLKVRGQIKCAIALGDALFKGDLAQIHYLSQDEIIETWRQFREFQDKDWSFTDISSKVVIERLSIRKAFAFDRHFRQFGSIEVLP